MVARFYLGGAGVLAPHWLHIRGVPVGGRLRGQGGARPHREDPGEVLDKFLIPVQLKFHYGVQEHNQIILAKSTIRAGV